MHRRLFENQKSLEPWTPHAEAIGLDVPRFEECLNDARQGDEIRRDMAEAARTGLTGTPGFFLAYTDPQSDKVRTVAALRGALPFSAFKAQIDRLLASEASAADEKPAEKPAQQ